MRTRAGWLIASLVLTPIAAAAPQEAGKLTPDPSIVEAAALMRGYAGRTGLDSDRPAQRYLWTDAFAVCNLLGLARATGDGGYTELAVRLVDQVHYTLGRHRPDDARVGWLSGLDASEGEAHPTRGGLRIGKPLPERGAGARVDERLEWERDGQYFHYLTRWMHALDQVSRTTGDPRYNAWARELAQAAYDAFTFERGGTPGMHWKMSIDLSRPLVASMGQHDPLDGYLTYLQLRRSAAELPSPLAGPDLGAAIDRFARMADSIDWISADSLGIGGLLIDAWRASALRGAGHTLDDTLPERILGAALAGLRQYAATGELQGAAGERLAFRELGLAIGLRAAERLQLAIDAREVAATRGTRETLTAVLRHAPLGDRIESFWRTAEHRRSRTWTEHRDISEVMLATRLAPDGFLARGSAPGTALDSPRPNTDP
jgi:hypothetical protein